MSFFVVLWSIIACFTHATLLLKVHTLQIVHINDKGIIDLSILHRLPIKDLPILQY